MLLTFTKPEFEQLIKDGIKKHTIRADKGNRWKVGNSIHFWRGNPRNTRGKVKPRQFGTGVASRVETVRMEFKDLHLLEVHDIVRLGTYVLETSQELDALAKNDGFNNWSEMLEWFDNDSRQFIGKIIFWDYRKCVWS